MRGNAERVALKKGSDGDYTVGPYRIQRRYLTASCLTAKGWDIVDTRQGPNALVGKIVAHRSTLADVRDYLAFHTTKGTR